MKAALPITLLCLTGFATTALAGTGEIRRADQPVHGSYIVLLHEEDQIPPAQRSAVLARQHGGQVTITWEDALHGFTIRATEAQARAISRHPWVKSVEEDAYLSIASTTQSAPFAMWGLDRIDQRNLPLTGTYSYCQSGANVKIYVVDTGIKASHVEFDYPSSGGSRVLDGVDYVSCLGCPGSARTPCSNTAWINSAGHGTGVASVAAGKTLGVAKNALLVPIRSIDCNGSSTSSKIVSGINWAARNHQPGEPAVLNMSFAFPGLDFPAADLEAIDFAVNGAIDDGIVAVAGAGNQNTNACFTSPARVPRALTVGATNLRDERWVVVTDPNAVPQTGSNHGACLDLFAPGSGIYTAHITANDAVISRSGTSISAPHVAGVAAQYLEINPSATPDQVNAYIISTATQNVISSYWPLYGAPNLLLYSTCN